MNNISVHESCDMPDKVYVSGTGKYAKVSGTYYIVDGTDTGKPKYENINGEKCGRIEWSTTPGKVGYHLLQCYPTRGFQTRTKFYTKK